MLNKQYYIHVCLWSVDVDQNGNRNEESNELLEEDELFDTTTYSELDEAVDRYKQFVGALPNKDDNRPPEGTIIVTTDQREALAMYLSESLRLVEQDLQQAVNESERFKLSAEEADIKELLNLFN